MDAVLADFSEIGDIFHDMCKKPSLSSEIPSMRVGGRVRMSPFLHHEKRKAEEN